MLFDVEYTEGEPETYLLPLALARGEEAERIVQHTPQSLIAYVEPEGEEGPQWLLYDALFHPTFSGALVEAIGARRRFAGKRGELTASPTRLSASCAASAAASSRSASAAPSRATRRSPSATG